MSQQVELGGKQVTVNVSGSAQRQLDRRQTPLCAEMELYFSCLIRKKVRFRESEECSNSVVAGDQLQVAFRPVMTKICGKDFEGKEPPLTDFPIANPKPYVPKWLNIDFRGGEWVGEFGY